MQIDNPFDKALEARFRQHSIPLVADVTTKSSEDLKSAAIFTVDTLDLCWAGVQAVYGNKAKPEHAFEAFDRVMQLLAGIRSDNDLRDSNHSGNVNLDGI